MNGLLYASTGMVSLRWVQLSVPTAVAMFSRESKHGRIPFRGRASSAGSQDLQRHVQLQRPRLPFNVLLVVEPHTAAGIERSSILRTEYMY